MDELLRAGAGPVLMLPAGPLLLAARFPRCIKAVETPHALTTTNACALAHRLANGALADVLLVDRISVGKHAERPVPAAPSSRVNGTIAVVGGLPIYWIFIRPVHVSLLNVVPMP